MVAAAFSGDDPLMFDPAPVNVRLKIASLWTSMLFVFAYVDIFGLYRPDIQAAVEAGRSAGSPSTRRSSRGRPPTWRSPA